MADDKPKTKKPDQPAAPRPKLVLITGQNQPATPAPRPYKSALAKSLNQFADNLDKEILRILCS